MPDLYSDNKAIAVFDRQDRFVGLRGRGAGQPIIRVATGDARTLVRGKPGSEALRPVVGDVPVVTYYPTNAAANTTGNDAAQSAARAAEYAAIPVNGTTWNFDGKSEAYWSQLVTLTTKKWEASTRGGLRVAGPYRVISNAPELGDHGDVAFWINSNDFVVKYAGFSPKTLKVMVDGAVASLVPPAPIAGHGGTNLSAVRIKFTDKAPRAERLVVLPGSFAEGGLIEIKAAEPAARLRPYTGPLIKVYGDSIAAYTGFDDEQRGAWTQSQPWGWFAARALGLPLAAVSARGGTGYVNQGGQTVGNFVDAIRYEPSNDQVGLVLCCVSGNDIGVSTEEAYRQAVRNFWTEARAKYPNAVLVQGSLIQDESVSAENAKINKMAKEVALSMGVEWLNCQVYTGNRNAGTYANDASKTDGNTRYLVGWTTGSGAGDLAHPNSAGIPVIGYEVAGKLAAGVGRMWVPD
jgi:hypothetical protein